MRWRLLASVTALEPGRSISGTARSDFPDALFADHFPSWPVTPGVLLIEMAAQLSGLLTQASVLASRAKWVFPVLALVREAKLRAFVPPAAELHLDATLVDLGAQSALCKAELRHLGRRCVSASLLLVFDRDGGAGAGDEAALRQAAREEYRRLGSPWQPRDDA
jgi:3-hydroxyacyl-[acyl-carrier-protein] dehydratase